MRGLNRAVASSKMFTLQVCRYSSPFEGTSPVHDKSVNTRMPGAPEQWPSSQLGACCGGEVLSFGAATPGSGGRSTLRGLLRKVTMPLLVAASLLFKLTAIFTPA